MRNKKCLISFSTIHMLWILKRTCLMSRPNTQMLKMTDKKIIANKAQTFLVTLTNEMFLRARVWQNQHNYPCSKRRHRSVLVTKPDRRQSKTFLTIDVRGSNIDRNSVFDCHLSPVGRQKMTIENSISNLFDLHVRSSIVHILTFSIAAYPVW